MNRVTRKKCHVKKKQVVRRGDEGDEGLEKWKGGRRRDCNLINPRLEVVRRSGQLVRARSLQTLRLHPRSAGKKGGARSPRLSFIDPPRLRSMRPYSQRLASDEFHARSRTRAAFSLSPAFINRDRTASRQALKYARRGAGGGDCLERGACARSRYTRTGCNYDANADAGIIRRISNEMCGADGGKRYVVSNGFSSSRIFISLWIINRFVRFHFNSWKQLVDDRKRFWIVTIIHCEESKVLHGNLIESGRINISCPRDFDLGWWSTIRFLANSSSFPIRMKRTIREQRTSPMGSAQGLVSGSLGCDCFSSRGKLCDTPPPTRWIRNGRSNLRSARYYLSRVYRALRNLDPFRI